MPGVNFQLVRELVSMSDVIDLIGFAPTTQSGPVLRGPCPIHHSRSTRSRSFAVDTERKVYCCFTCGSAGNHLDLFAAVTQKGVFEAALELCAKLRRPVPWIHSRG